MKIAGAENSASFSDQLNLELTLIATEDEGPWLPRA
jgi:hypothetical protein